MNPLLTFLSTNPELQTLQLMLLAAACIAVFLVFFTARDISLRSRSLFMQLFCILLVAVLPILGFFVYLLLRPPRTIKDRDTERLLEKLIALQAENLSIISFEQTHAQPAPAPVAVAANAPLSNLPSSASFSPAPATLAVEKPTSVPVEPAEKAKPKKSSRHLQKGKSRH